MWTAFRNLFSWPDRFDGLFGDVAFRTEQETGQFQHSFLEWRVKKGLNSGELLIGLAMKPDGYAGPDGSVTNYINFDLETAVRLRDKLDECIEFASRR